MVNIISKFMKDNRGIQQFLKFSLVGFSNFLVSFTVFYLIYNYAKVSEIIPEIGKIDAAFANACGYAVGIINSFIWNRSWTFKQKQGVVKQFPKFILLNLFCLLFSSLGIYYFVDILEFPFIFIWFVVNIITTFINFFGNKFWVFHEVHKKNL